ncbi:MAG: hypothetical protein KAS32_11945 [Candidatus Peribacteraceae bacterium]|nr:hypothetical protein [Candidatus Peribacteraceae bacterium]
MLPIRIDDRVIGILDYINRTFTKDVRKSKHLFRKLDAWGIDAAYFTDTLLPGQYTIRIFESEEKIMYKINAVDWDKQVKKENSTATMLHFNKGNEDHHAQTFLPRRFFKKYNMKQQ